MKTFADRVKYIVNNVFSGSKSVAQELGLSDQAVRDYINGKSFPRQNFFDLLISKGISIDWLLSGMGDMRIGNIVAEPQPIYLHGGEINGNETKSKLTRQVDLIKELLNNQSISTEVKLFMLDGALKKIRDIENNDK